MINELVIASHNRGKIVEIGALLEPLGISVKSAGELGISEPEETGSTFIANADLKARHSAVMSGLPALADDSGLVVPAIAGAPGIYSARWAGEKKDFSMAFQRIKDELEKANAPLNTTAYFVCALSLCMPDGDCAPFEGRVYGTLTFPPRGTQGFGYDPIFIPDGYEQSFAEIPAEIKNKISHRASAFFKFLEYIRSLPSN